MHGIRSLDLDQLVNDGVIRLEITGGIPTWEASPGPRHQLMVYRIQTSIKPSTETNQGCEGAHLADVYVRFKDGSIKRPDIAIFCAMPPTQDEALTMTPQAVVEVISPGYEFKDITLSPQFYLAQDVGDVVVVDPRSGVVTHHRTTGVSIHQALITLNLQCGLPMYCTRHFRRSLRMMHLSSALGITPANYPSSLSPPGLSRRQHAAPTR